MKIIMAGIDHHIADIEIREKVGFVPGEVKKILKRIEETAGVAGVVILATCNRTEVYYTYEQGRKPDPVAVFCQAADLAASELAEYFYIKEGEAVARYIFELACGMHSLIFGEDQIIGQVKEALQLAQEVQVTDALLNTLFRSAVTCAKKVKTQVIPKDISPSIASKVEEFLRDYLSKKGNGHALVIGNGLIGRKVAEELRRQHCQVTITLRNMHRKHKIIVPQGCQTIPYDARQKILSQVDILISATASPHQTITSAMLGDGQPGLKYVIDLAVPRDIDPRIADLPGITYANIDTLGEEARLDSLPKIAAMEELIKEQMARFQKWHCHRENMINLAGNHLKIGNILSK